MAHAAVRSPSFLAISQATRALLAARRKSWLVRYSRASNSAAAYDGDTERWCMSQLSVAAGAEMNKVHKQDLRNIHKGLAQLRANITKAYVAVRIVMQRRVVCPYTEPATYDTRVTSASYVSG